MTENDYQNSRRLIFSRSPNQWIDVAVTPWVGSSSDITQQNRNSDLTVVLQVKRTLPCKSLSSTQELHLKPGGAEGAALFGVLIFCLLPLLIGPCSGPSAEISLVTSYNSPLPAAGSNGAGDISITSTEQEGKKKPKTKPAERRHPPSLPHPGVVEISN